MIPKISICIPTYNRAKFIDKTLQSIITQATSDVEIVVSDNASTDDTEHIISEFRKIFENIVYVRLSTNLGADANFLNVVEHARGEYCWLFGSDDIMMPGALSALILNLEAKPAVILSNRIECDLNLRPNSSKEWLKGSASKRIYDFSNEVEIIRYFKSVISLGGAFSYISNIVFDRKSWASVLMDSRVMGTAYSHVYMVMSILLSGKTLLYIPDRYVYCRMGNDSFMESGFAKRILLDIDGFIIIADILLKEREKVRRAFLSPLCKEHHVFRIARVLKQASEDCMFQDVRDKFLDAGFDSRTVKNAELLSKSYIFKSNNILNILLFIKSKRKKFRCFNR